MIITKLALPRRTFLRGIGVTLALPLLDAMVPALTAVAKTAANPVRRLGFVYIPNGVAQTKKVNYWRPSGEGSGFGFSDILAPLEPLRDYVNVISGMAHRQAESFGDGNADHHRGPAAWLTGMHAVTRSTQFTTKLTTTADQIAAHELGQYTQLPSLELATENPTSIACDSGADCFYSNTISWRSQTTPNPMEVQPRIVFDRLFGEGGSAADRTARARSTGSILDSVAAETKRLNRLVGASDRTKLSEYFDSVREIEQRVQRAEQGGAREIELPDRPLGIPESYEEHVKLMFDLLALAYQGDITRVFTMLLAVEQSSRSYPEIGVDDGHHAISHHQDDLQQIAKYAKVCTYHVQLFGYFLEKLRSIPDGDGSLLDHSIFLYGGGIGDGNMHDHHNLPTLLAGGGGGRLAGGRHLVYPETPMTNLLLTLLDKVDVSVDKLGDSTGRLAMDGGFSGLSGV